MENSFVCVDHENTKPRQHCNYRGVHLSTAASKHGNNENISFSFLKKSSQNILKTYFLDK